MQQKLKPFDLEAARSGKPIQCRSGRPVRIICFDRINTEMPLLALVEEGGKEEVITLTTEGKFHDAFTNSGYDLFMAPQKKTVYVNFYRYPNEVRCSQPFTSFQEAEAKSKEVIYGPGDAQRVEDVIEIREITLEL